MTAKTLQGLHVHFDPVAGIAGDMTVAALVDAGVPAAVVADAVASLGLPGLGVRFETRRRGAFVGRGFIVDEPAPEVRSTDQVRGARSSSRVRGRPFRSAHRQPSSHEHTLTHPYAGVAIDRPPPGHAHQHSHVHPHPAPPVRERGRGRAAVPAAAHHHRDYADIRGLLARATLAPEAKALAQELFAKLAEVEAALHGVPVEKVSFHEVGAFDSIADIVGMAAAIAWLAPVSIGSSPPVVGTGTVRTAHGLVAVPAPATAALLRGLPMIAEGEGELTTPTGAVFLATVVDSFGPPPPLRLTAVGYGAGTRVLSDRANVLRVMLGDPIGRGATHPADQVLVLETNIDDMTGQLLAALSDALFKAGALDVWSTPILMKKGRPAQQVSALAEPGTRADVERAFFLNSTTLGVRIYPVSRRTLARSSETVSTAFGPISVKVAALDGAPLSAGPEYEDCRRGAVKAGVPVRKVWTAAVAASEALLTAPRAPVGAGSGRRGKRRPS